MQRYFSFGYPLWNCSPTPITVSDCEYRIGSEYGPLSATVEMDRRFYVDAKNEGETSFLLNLAYLQNQEMLIDQEVPRGGFESYFKTFGPYEEGIYLLTAECPMIKQVPGYPTPLCKGSITLRPTY